MKTIKFPEVIGELNYNQFIEVCRIFGVPVVDRESVKVETEEDTKDIEKHLKDAKMRRDFDVMIEELLKKYQESGRGNRRAIDRITTKIILANRTARKILNEKVVNEYDAGVRKMDEVLDIITESNSDGDIDG